MDSISLHTSRSNYEEYREAWKLLGPDLGWAGDSIDIQACAEEFSGEWIQ
jgi:hypothetical protein